MSDNTVELNKMPLLDHLIELRQRLLYSVLALFGAFIVAFFFAQGIYDFLNQPLADILLEMGASQDQSRRMIATDLTEVFFTQIKVAFFAAAFFSCPIFLSQIWFFMAPGLYKHERSAFAPFLIASPILFFIGGALVYYLIMPMAWSFFLGFETAGGENSLPIQFEPKVNEYLSLVMKLIFAFGICFQLPVIMTLLARVGLATSAGMAAKRKYAIVGVFIVAAIFTPPDPLSQISLAIPIILLYEVSIYMAKIVERKRGEREEEMEEELDDETGGP